MLEGVARNQGNTSPNLSVAVLVCEDVQKESAVQWIKNEQSLPAQFRGKRKGLEINLPRIERAEVTDDGREHFRTF